MAIATAISRFDMAFQNAWFAGVPPTSFTSTQVKLTFGWHELYFTGTGFSFPANSAPTGTITGMSFYGQSPTSAFVLKGTITGLNANLATFVNALHPGDASATPASYLAAMGVLFAGSDTFNCSSNDDAIYGFAGNDVINGGAGDDYIEGGLGNDVINGGLGIDIAGYTTATAAVAVNLTLTTQQNTVGAGFDTLSSIEKLAGSNFNDILSGNALANLLQGGLGNDTLRGFAGNDILEGNSGNDLITGGAGRDGLIGGGGSDWFVYTAASDSATYAARDTILDFTTGTVAGVGDKIDLRLIDANSTVAGNQAFTYIGGSNSFTAAGQLRLVNSVVYGNTDANLSTSEIVIELNIGGGNIGLVAGNFLL